MVSQCKNPMSVNKRTICLRSKHQHRPPLISFRRLVLNIPSVFKVRANRKRSCKASKIKCSFMEYSSITIVFFLKQALKNNQNINLCETILRTVLTSGISTIKSTQNGAPSGLRTAIPSCQLPTTIIPFGAGASKLTFHAVDRVGNGSG